MQDFDFLTVVHEDFLGRTETSNVIVSEGISIIKSGVPKIPMNVCFIKNDNVDAQKEFVLNNLNVPTIFYTSNLSNFSFKSWATEKNIFHHREFSLMSRSVQGEFFKSPFYDDIKIYRVMDEISLLKDLVILYSKSKNIEPMDVYKVFENILPNQYFYIAYVNDKPASFFLGISLGEKGFIMDAYVEPKYRSIGLLKIMSSKIKEDAVANGVINFYGFAMSFESENVMIQDRYSLREKLNLWTYSPMI